MDEVMLWTPNGCWLQTKVNGVVRSSYLGKRGTIEEVRGQCAEMAIRFEVFKDSEAKPA